MGGFIKTAGSPRYTQTKYQWVQDLLTKLRISSAAPGGEERASKDDGFTSQSCFREERSFVQGTPRKRRECRVISRGQGGRRGCRENFGRSGQRWTTTIARSGPRGGSRVVALWSLRDVCVLSGTVNVRPDSLPTSEGGERRRRIAVCVRELLGMSVTRPCCP